MDDAEQIVGRERNQLVSRSLDLSAWLVVRRRVNSAVGWLPHV